MKIGRPFKTGLITPYLASINTTGTILKFHFVKKTLAEKMYHAIHKKINQRPIELEMAWYQILAIEHKKRSTFVDWIERFN